MATELAKAYVQIVPSADGIKGSITQALGGEASTAGDSAGEHAGSSFISKIKGMIAAAGIGAAVKQALSYGADLEQSIGGIETLFGTGGNSIEEYAAQVGKSVEEISGEYEKLKNSEETMLAYADQAYKTAGLSANDYMQTVTGFAASLKQSTGDDMEALTSAANQAVIDMADNANKMGTEMASIQNAYQGFAKQNYTMLDNLKLGYGGTKEEMERLLADASQISGIEYNLDNLADVYAAIHVIQNQLGITGTTAKEAATTFSGSLASMKSAGQNLIAKLTLGEDIGPSLQALRDSVFTFVADNLIPMVGNLLNGIPEMAQGIISMTIQALNIGKRNAGDILQMGVDIITELTSALISSTPYLIEGVWNLLTAFGEALLSFEWIETAQLLISDIKDNLDLAAGEILGTDGNIIASLGQAITNSLPQILDKGIEIITSLVNGIIQSLPALISAAGTMINSYLDFIVKNLPVVIEKGGALVMSLVEGISNNLPVIITSAGDMLNAFIARIMESFPEIVEQGMDIIMNIAQGISDAIPNIVEAMATVISNLIITIAQHLPQVIQSGFNLLTSFITGIINCIPSLVAALPQVISAIFEAFTSVDWGEIGMNILEGIKNGILGAVDSVVSAAKNAASSIYNAITDFFRIGSPSKLMRDDVGHWLPPGIAVGVENNMTPVEKAMTDLGDTAIKSLDMSSLSLSASNGRLALETDKSNSGDKLDEVMTKMEVLAEYLISSISELQLVAMVDRDDIFTSVKQSAEEFKEQTHKPAFA